MFIKKLIRFRILFIALFTLCLALFPPLVSEYFTTTANAQSTSLPAEYVGVWEGRGAQTGSEWSILIALTPGDVNTIIGTVAYPSLSCGGQLALRKVSAQSVELSETLTYVRTCVNNGVVSLRTTSNGRLQYQWFYSNGSLAATGSLQRISSESRASRTPRSPQQEQSPLPQGQIPPQQEQSPPQQAVWYSGGWRGRIAQTGRGTGGYEGVFSLKPASIGEVFGTSTYIELNCGGNLTLLSMSESVIEFQETLTYGQSSCVSGVRKTLNLVSKDAISYRLSPNQGLDATATATLRKMDNSNLPKYLGNWKGAITQPGSVKYSGKFDFKQGNVGDRFGSSAYPELSCGGELTLLSVSGSSLEFQENITYGSRCITGVRKTVTFLSNNTLDYQISGQPGRATARLRRT